MGDLVGKGQAVGWPVRSAEGTTQAFLPEPEFARYQNFSKGERAARGGGAAAQLGANCSCLLQGAGASRMPTCEWPPWPALPAPASVSLLVISEPNTPLFSSTAFSQVVGTLWGHRCGSVRQEWTSSGRLPLHCSPTPQSGSRKPEGEVGGPRQSPSHPQACEGAALALVSPHVPDIPNLSLSISFARDPIVMEYYNWGCSWKPPEGKAEDGWGGAQMAGRDPEAGHLGWAEPLAFNTFASQREDQICLAYGAYL